MKLVTRGLLCLYLIFSTLAFLARLYNIAVDDFSTKNSDPSLLVLVIGRTPLWALWTLVFTPFIELEVIPLLVTMLVMWTGGHYCEQIWSSKKYIVFCAICIYVPTLSTALLYLVLSSFRDGSWRINGMAGYIAAVCVALKQLVSEHIIILLKGRIRIKIRWIPAILLCVLPILDMCRMFDNLGEFVMGFLCSWVYLRFFQELPEMGPGRTRLMSKPLIRGDASDSFAFDQFFPLPLSNYVAAAVLPVYKLFTGLKLIPVFSESEVESANRRYATRLSGSVLPFYNTTRTTNERRRAMLENLDSID